MKVYVVKTSWYYESTGDGNEINKVFTDKQKADELALAIVQEEIDNHQTCRQIDFDLANDGHFIEWDNGDWFESIAEETELVTD